MMLLLILLLLSIVLNLVLIFMLVKTYDEAKLNIVSVEGPDGDEIEHLELNKSSSFFY